MITGKNESEFLSRLLYVMGRLTSVPKDQATFVLLNETNTAVPFKIAAAFSHDKLIGITSADKIVSSSPVVEEFNSFYSNAPHDKITATQADLGFEHLGTNVLIIPSRDVVTIFTRDDAPFNEHEVNALNLFTTCYEKVINYHSRKPIKIKKIAIIAAAIVFAVSMTPLRTSTHERGEVDLYNGVSIKSSMNGIIKTVDVEPNQTVHKGQPLIHFDDRQIRADYQVAQDELNVAQSQYDAALQQGMGGDDKARSQVLVQKNRIQEEKDKVAYQEKLLNKTVLTAPSDGVIMFSDKASITGKPVSIGEKILELSDPNSRLLKIYVPTQDIITFKKGSQVSFFDNTRPTHAYKGTISRVPFQAVAKPDQTLVYEYKAELKTPDRPGLQGTAVIYGKRIPLALWLFRKPIAFIRAYIG